MTRSFVDTHRSLEELDEDTTSAVKTTRSFVYPPPGKRKDPGAPVFSKIEKDYQSRRKVISDLEAGVGDSDLMHKYGLLPQQLELLYRKLLDVGLIDCRTTVRKDKHFWHDHNESLCGCV